MARLQHFNMFLVPNQQLTAAGTGHAPSPELRCRYLQTVGSLMYAMLGTCPDLAFAMGVLGCFASKPDNSHWAAVKRLLHYIKGTLDGLQYSPEDSPVIGFKACSDSNWDAE